MVWKVKPHLHPYKYDKTLITDDVLVHTGSNRVWPDEYNYECGDHNFGKTQNALNTESEFVELNDLNNALSYYNKAINNSDNSFTSAKYLMKQALIMEENSDYDKALEIYIDIQDNYVDSREAQNIEKYIYRAQNR